MQDDDELEEEVIEEETESNESSSEDKIKLNFDMDPSDRLQIEIDNNTDEMAKNIGRYLLDKFNNDEPLKKAYKDRKITLYNIMGYIQKCAAKMLNNVSGGIEDKVVYGWVLHYVQDEEVKITTEETVTISKQDKEAARKRAVKRYEDEQLEKLKKEEERKLKAELKKKEKEKQKQEESGQMSLFDLED